MELERKQRRNATGSQRLWYLHTPLGTPQSSFPWLRSPHWGTKQHALESNSPSPCVSLVFLPAFPLCPPAFGVRTTAKTLLPPSMGRSSILRRERQRPLVFSFISAQSVPVLSPLSFYCHFSPDHSCASCLGSSTSHTLW